jgi:hypothetical protein
MLLIFLFAHFLGGVIVSCILVCLTWMNFLAWSRSRPRKGNREVFIGITGVGAIVVSFFGGLLTVVGNEALTGVYDGFWQLCQCSAIVGASPGIASLFALFALFVPEN